MKTIACFFIFLLLTTTFIFAQADRDSVINNPLRVDIKNASWGLRVCNGIQKSYYFDIGLSRDHFLGSPHGMYSDALFVAFSMFPSFTKSTPAVYGIKGGAEIWGNMFGLGLDMGYYSNSNAEDFIITPKIGIGISKINVVYGYGFSTTHNAISRIGKHTVALQIDIPFQTKNKLKEATN